MDYEEKYEQAMFRMNKWAEGSEITDPKEVAEFVFPELKESEDEKIRKYLIDIVNDYCKGSEHDGCIAWLEKQGTKESKKTSIWNHWKDGIAGNGASKLIYLIKNGNDYSLSSVLGHECDYILLSDLDKLMLEEKQGEQKPEIKYIYPKFRVGDVIEPTKPNGHYVPVRVKYIDEEHYSCESDDHKAFLSLPMHMENDYVLAEQKPAELNEDEKIRQELIRAFSVTADKRGHEIYGNGITYGQVLDWLEKQGEQKSTWSEEDERLLSKLQTYVDIECFDRECNGEDLLKWLKSLKPAKWGEEDESMCIRTLGILGKCYMGELPIKVEEELNWLKSLKERMKGE